MIYPSRVFSAACARLGSFFGTPFPSRRISTENSLHGLLRLSAAVVLMTPIPYFVLCIPFLIFFTAVDIAFNPPYQYFAQGSWVYRHVPRSRESSISVCISSPALPSLGSSSSLSENYTVNTLLPTYNCGSTSFCRQQSALDSEPVAQDLDNMLFPDYFPCPDGSYCHYGFGGADIIQNCINAAASPIGLWLWEGTLMVKETLTSGKVGGES